ncbi:MAG: 16S rRNA (adenine(1518)-N(6)/adenine(1519)-N(6))-dimethyltransferase RsmA [Rhizobiales bacterium]|nr:16S rRNA (adenine(1518)-N(6)/adenine(1519)-N(6))-dimethyltransferase RsmA [Hyphomicrobiales bacterium]
MGSSAAPGDGLPALREVIRLLELRARRSLGQNFILDLNLTRRIARLVPDLAARSIVEIGPGPGGLTRGLLMEGAGRVLAVERDERFLPALAAIAEAYPGRLEVRHADALELDYSSLVTAPGAIVANLPYNIATPLLTGWLTLTPWPDWLGLMALMFQKEVAERIAAPVGTPAYGRLSVLAQWRAEVRLALTLPPAAFTPPPKVSSAVVVFRPRPVPEPVCAPATLERVTAAAFGQRRKMLRASLKTLVAEPEALLEAAAIEPTERAEHVPVAGFVRLAAALEAQNAAGDRR